MTNSKSPRDYALEGLSPELKAITLEMAAKSKIDASDPLWLVFLPSAQTTVRLGRFEQALASVATTAGEASQLAQELGSLKIFLEQLDQRYQGHWAKVDRISKSLDINMIAPLLAIFLGFACGSAGWSWFGQWQTEKRIKSSFEASTYNLRFWQDLATQENGKRLDACYSAKKKECTLLRP